MASPTAASSFTQADRLFKLESPLGDTLLLDRFQGVEALSAPFSYTLQLLSERPDLVPEDLVGQQWRVLLASRGGERRFGGYVTGFARTGWDGGFAFYRATLGPWTEFLKHRVNCRIFHEQGLPDLLRALFGEYGALARYQFRLAEASYPPMAHCTQYCESDFHFMARLLEAHGIYYHFRFDGEGHTLVLGDDSRAAPAMPERDRIGFAAGGAGGQEGLDRWGSERVLVASDYAIQSFDFQHPRNPAAARAATTRPVDRLPKLEHYEHEGSYAYRDDQEAQRLAGIRVQEQDLRSRSFQGAGNCRFLTVGHGFELAAADDPGGPVHDRKFLVTEVHHSGANNYRQADEGQPHYRNTFTCVPKAVRYRPPRTTPRPVMPGPQTATVVGPEGEEIFCDRYGRVKVRFHWERDGASGEAASCWARVATPWAGRRFGFVAVPRIGQEVLVAFLEGNPDRPIVTGQAWNELNLPPWELPASSTQSGLLTRSSKGGTPDQANALRFEDRSGAEEVWLHAERAMRLEVEQDERHEVGHDRSKRIEHDESIQVGHDRGAAVANDETLAIGHDRSQTVGGDEAVTIAGHHRHSVGRSQELTVAATKTEQVGLASNERVGGAKTLAVGGAYAVTVAAAKNEAVGLGSFEQVGAEKCTLVGGTYRIAVAGQLEITVGEARLVMAQDGTITLSGVTLNLEGDRQVRLQGQVVDLN